MSDTIVIQPESASVIVGGDDPVVTIADEDILITIQDQKQTIDVSEEIEAISVEESARGPQGDPGLPGPPGPPGPPGTGSGYVTVTTYYSSHALSTEQAVVADATGGAMTLTLPVSAGDGQTFHIKKTDATANVVTVLANLVTPDAIDGNVMLELTNQWDSVTLVATAAHDWSVM